MSDRTAPLPKSEIDAMNEFLGRFCDARGPDFLTCSRSRGHDGMHYDALRKTDWKADEVSEKNFNGNITVKQDFRDQDPDRVAIVFKRELGKRGEK